MDSIFDSALTRKIRVKEKPYTGIFYVKVLDKVELLNVLKKNF